MAIPRKDVCASVLGINEFDALLVYDDGRLGYVDKRLFGSQPPESRTAFVGTSQISMRRPIYPQIKDLERR